MEKIWRSMTSRDPALSFNKIRASARFLWRWRRMAVCECLSMIASEHQHPWHSKTSSSISTNIGHLCKRLSAVSTVVVKNFITTCGPLGYPTRELSGIRYRGLFGSCLIYYRVGGVYVLHIQNYQYVYTIPQTWHWNQIEFELRSATIFSQPGTDSDTIIIIFIRIGGIISEYRAPSLLRASPEDIPPPLKSDSHGFKKRPELVLKLVFF